MIVSAIAAMDRTALIGNGMNMPWHLPRDLKRFREYTWGKPLILGRRTLESIRTPLKGRLNIVLTHDPSFLAAGCHIARSLDEAFEIAGSHLRETGGDEAMIIGGKVVFEESLPLWNRLYLTVVEGEFQGDTYFPISQLRESRWRIVGKEFCEADSKNANSHWFLALERQDENSSSDQDFDLASWLNDPSGPIPGCRLTRR